MCVGDPCPGRSGGGEEQEEEEGGGGEGHTLDQDIRAWGLRQPRAGRPMH